MLSAEEENKGRKRGNVKVGLKVVIGSEGRHHIKTRNNEGTSPWMCQVTEFRAGEQQGQRPSERHLLGTSDI